MGLAGSAGGNNCGSITTNTGYVGGNGGINQWGQVLFNGYPLSGGWKGFGQSIYVETTIPTSGGRLPTIPTSGASLTIGETNQIGEQPSSSCGWSNTNAAAVTLSYPVYPAVGIGGYVDFANGGGGIPGATVTINQDDNNQFTNFNVLTDSTGHWHFFAKPGATYEWWATVSNSATYEQSSFVVIPTATTALSNEGNDVTSTGSVSFSSGQVYGWVSQVVGSVKWYIAGATVTMCDNYGCFSTTTNSNGEYWLNYFHAGSGSNPQSLKISAPGETTTTYTGLQFPLDQIVHQDLAFPPSGGGGCVAYGTPILTPSGYVPVQNLHQGDSVMEYDLVNQSLVDGAFLYGNSTWVKSLIDINNGLLYLTPTDQPVFIQNNSFIGWLHDPQNLTAGDNLYEPATQSWIHVNSVVQIHHHGFVYDVVTTAFNDFVANGVLLDHK